MRLKLSSAPLKSERVARRFDACAILSLLELGTVRCCNDLLGVAYQLFMLSINNLYKVYITWMNFAPCSRILLNVKVPVDVNTDDGHDLYQIWSNND